jgi:hypothetical protein
VTRAMISVAALGLCACASPMKKVKAPTGPLSAEAKAAEEQDKRDQAKMICTWEKPIGSNISEKVCRTPEQIEQEREDTQRAIHSTPGGSPMQPGG